MFNCSNTEATSTPSSNSISRAPATTESVEDGSGQHPSSTINPGIDGIQTTAFGKSKYKFA